MIWYFSSFMLSHLAWTQPPHLAHSIILKKNQLYHSERKFNAQGPIAEFRVLKYNHKIFFKGWWHLVAFIDHNTHLYEIVRHQLSYMQLYNTQHAYFCAMSSRQCIFNTISLIQIRYYAAVFYGALLRISPATFLQLKIQLETARFEPRTFQVPV